jgi:hypothetical protein
LFSFGTNRYDSGYNICISDAGKIDNQSGISGAGKEDNQDGINYENFNCLIYFVINLLLIWV